MSTHSHLENLEIVAINVRRNECVALANLLRYSATGLHTLCLWDNIDDEGLDILVGGLTDSRLNVLQLALNSITARGWRSLASLLEHPNCNLERLHCSTNNDECVLVVANALISNHKLKFLGLGNRDYQISAEGWSIFSKILCDTSSINNTFLSNHTLSFEHSGFVTPTNLPDDVRSSGAFNRSSEDKKQVAIKKILKHHHHFDMQPFFEWDLKVLPLAVSWFERARSVDSNNEAAIDKNKLGSIFQFIRAMPEDLTTI